MVDEFLTNRLGAPVSSGQEEVRYECPSTKCTERRLSKGSDPKLYVNVFKRTFYCMRCSWGGTLRQLYNYLGGEYDPSNEISLVPEEAPVVAACQLPPVTDDWSSSPDAWNWLCNRFRSIPVEELYGLVQRGVIRKGTKWYWDRVVLCDIYNECLRYWTARAIYDNVQPKYKNPRMSRSSIMFNQQRIEDYKYEEVLICEGIINALILGENAVATYGRCVTPQQLEILSGFECDRYVIISESDRDAKNNTLQLAESLMSRKKEVYIVDCPEGKDPGDIGRSDFLGLIENTKQRYSWKTYIHRRLAYAS